VWFDDALRFLEGEGDVLVVVDQVAHDHLCTFVDTHDLDESIFMNKDDADMGVP
jgi:hypothetical protein